MSNCGSCVPAPIAQYNRLTEILEFIEARFPTPACGTDYCDELADILTELQTIATNTGGAAAAVTVSMTQNTNTSGTVAANWKSVTFINQGSTTVTILGQTVQPGVSISAGDFGAAPTNAIAWSVPSGGDLLILEAR